MLLRSASVITAATTPAMRNRSISNAQHVRRGFTYRVVEGKTGYHAPAAPVLELPRRGKWINVIFAAALAGRRRTLLEIVDDKLLPKDVFSPPNALGEIEARLASGGTIKTARHLSFSQTAEKAPCHFHSRN
jgi:hypothetical protein